MKNDKEMVIYIIDIAAFLVKKILVIALCSILGLVITLCLHIISSNTDNKTEKYLREASDYELNLRNLNTQRNNLIEYKSILQKQKAEDPIVLMNDGRTIFLSSIMLSLSYSDEKKENLEKSLSAITSTINAFIKSMDYAGLINSSISNQYLKQFVELEGDEGVYSIMIYTDDVLIPSKLAEYVFNDISDFVNSRNDLKLVEINMTTDLYSGTKILKEASLYDSKIIEQDKLIGEKTKEILELESNPITKYHFARYAVIGFIVGAFLSSVFLIFSFVQKNLLTSSFKVENRIEKPFLGAIFSDKGLFDVISRNLIGERKFKNDSDAKSFLEGNIRSVLKNASCVAILSTSHKKNILKASDAIHSTLEQLGYKALFVSDSTNNPEASAVVEEADVVLLLEEQWKSRWILVDYNYTLCERFGKPIGGFILC